MGFAKNTGREFAKRFLILLLGLALFAAPLSHKFYLFSSQHGFRHITSAGNADRSGYYPIALPDHHQCRLLSLDKRYDHKQTYGLVFPFLIPITSAKAGKPEHYVPTDLTVVRSVSSSYLRGPPVFPFINFSA